MTEKQARQLCEQAGAPLPAGMHAGNFEKVVGTHRKLVDGIGFRSTLEANVYQLLKAWERIGEIRGLKVQPRYILQDPMIRNGRKLRAITWTGDFYFERRFAGLTAPGVRKWEPIVIDAKGYRMETYRVKVKIFQALHPEITFEEWNEERLKRNGG